MNNKYLKIEKPTKKNGLYIAKVFDIHTNKQFRIKINLAKYISLNKIPASGDVLKIWLNPKNEIMKTAVIDVIKQIDQEVLDVIKMQNNHWFRNELTEEKINSLYRPSFNVLNNTLSILNANTQQSILISDNNIVDTIHDIDFTETDLLLDIEIQGLYFFQKKCGIRWILRKLVVSKEASQESTEDWIDRRAIEDAWEDDLAVINKSIDENCNILATKINKLQDFKDEINGEFAESKETTISADWNTKLRNLSLKIIKYHEGTI